MAAVAFGRFTLIDPHGDSLGDVIIAPECILLQRMPAAAVRDVSYLALWSTDRVEAIAKELASLARIGSTVIGPTTPELHTILRAIAPATAPMFVGAGRCRRRFARHTLKGVLERTPAKRQPVS